MDADQFEKLNSSLGKIAAATLAASIIGSLTRKPTLKELQMAFNDCYMIVNPSLGTAQQDEFQQRVDKVEW